MSGTLVNGGMGDNRLEAGTAPEDRRFRPDVEGLRAVAIVLVVLYHAGLRGLGGGYVGVDVFFVISGFVITGVLLREQASSGRTSLLSFYGRRARRIIPAATVTIVVTVSLAYVILGVIIGNQTAIDGRWATAFLANFHFASVGTDYLSFQQPPSPLQNFWSLAVEEQFYLVYPTVFLVVAAACPRLSLSARLAVGLVAAILASFVLSVVQTASNPSAAFFSPLTRAWELALGALVAVGTSWLLRVPRAIGAVMTWLGLAAIGFAAITYSGTTSYPGWLVAVPVVGTALVIAGGVTTPAWGAEALLGLAPFRWLGRISYSLYLWHWPILILAAEAAGRSSLPFARSWPWLLVALGVSVVSYLVIENPIRRSRWQFIRGPRAVAMGVVLIVASLGVVTLQLDSHTGPVSAGTVPDTAPGPTTGGGVTDPRSEVIDAVRHAPQIRALPADLSPPFGALRFQWGGPPAPCWPAIGQSSIPTCEFGDPKGARTVVLYGDSHAGMWFDAMNRIAKQAGWKLVYLGKGDCPADMLPYQNPPGWGAAGGEYAVCDQWHRFALDRINRIRPDLVVVTQDYRTSPSGATYTPAQWQRGLDKMFAQLRVPAARVVVLGDIPTLPVNSAQCLVQHPTDVQTCSHVLSPFAVRVNRAEEESAAGAGAQYVDVTPWFCSTTCTAVVSRYQVYWDRGHITANYSYFLQGVLAQAIGLPAAA